MNIKKIITAIVAFILNLLIIYGVILAQNQELNYNNRDPFVPLLDEKNNISRDFKKSSAQIVLPKVSLQGITKLGDTLYVMIDGELLKEGQTIKEMVIVKVEPDKVMVRYGENNFELKWGSEKK